MLQVIFKAVKRYSHLPASRRAGYVMLVLFLGGCATLGGLQLSKLYGPSQPRDRQVAVLEQGQVDYWHDVKPVIEHRCVVCHGCYDAPCQLKLSSIEGIERGASSETVYDAARLFEAEPTRLFVDAQTVSEWREKGFHPILNEHMQSPEANRAAGVMYQLLQLKSQNTLPATPILDDTFTFGLDREHECAKPDDIASYSAKHPLWGMPYALPGLSQPEQQAITRWLEEGAQYTPRAGLPPEFKTAVSAWESFLNQGTLKGRLASRYIYEHLFLAHLYFDDLDKRRYFRLVRSRTAPGEHVDLIASRRPYDDPGVDRVYYRLVEYPAAIVAKTHMPYALNANRMQRWQQLFFDRDYQVATLPGYDAEAAANPFRTFKQIPVTTRYQFMLDEAQFTVMGFIKGPVCRGQAALNVINDQFWVFFVKPSGIQDTAMTDFLAENSHLLTLPSEMGSIFRPLTAWRNYSHNQREYMRRRDEYLLSVTSGPVALNLDVLWDGDGVNDNAALTIFRHFDSATVEKGMLGAPPKTAWVIGYMELERIHYLLVAGYDVFGNVGHQLLSRLYMDFLRMEGESTFLLLLPSRVRNQERAEWYRGADEELLTYLHSPEVEKANQETAIKYTTDNPKNELYAMLKQRFAPVLPEQRQLSSLDDRQLAAQLGRLSDFPGSHILQLPENSILLVETETGDDYFSVLRNSAHLNITSMFGEQKNRIPEEDRLLVMRGFVGSYPNAFFKVPLEEVENFVQLVGQSGTEPGYARLMDRFAVRRTNPDFWKFSDRVHQGFSVTEKESFGLLDYNRLENR